jgi:hypothetical protein
MTAVEWLIEELKKVHHPTEAMIMYAKKLEKQQIIDAYSEGDKDGYPDGSYITGEEYYTSTYGSKGSDDTTLEQIDQNNPVTRGSTALLKKEQKKLITEIMNEDAKDGLYDTSSQTELSNKSWEGCDGCTEQDEIMYKNGYVKGYNAAISELPKEPSDEEIEKAAAHHEPVVTRRAWISACKWYREQLKSK